MSEVRRITDPETLKALAHPMRQKLQRLLLQLGPATVGTLAEKVDGDPGQVSYHLRKLAEAGFIEEAPELVRDFRQRWWRAVLEPHSWSSSDFESPAGRVLVKTLNAQWVVEQFQAVRESRKSTAKEQFGEEWQGASTSSQSFLRLTAAETIEMVAEFQALCKRWSRYSEEHRDDGTPGRENVRFFYHTFPERP
ncbi:winged helix-turn-helix domain-containing protein [Stackebrandtia nassauensis]|uniref:Transcriptional regulator, ArsR family n=1 Tax=Stackebrandtia nassauensis (strain DSM 44728 / CIP 108903 / NRRL B-16338 / NBRC 102104 / LLR-40K-21) TaxID=446470 RepID=D3Q9L9_STANL|nr:helix-turn-helix domain-containing protein [Stackebrandtia nassauensis]ADD44565.1 transcriptional regulator, ArsR family [Stackebrandtia nassauensis DSM 44728]